MASPSGRAPEPYKYRLFSGVRRSPYLTSIALPTTDPASMRRGESLRLLGRALVRVRSDSGRGGRRYSREIGRVRIDRREVEVDGTLACLTPVAAERQFVGDSLTNQRGDVSLFWRRRGVVDEIDVSTIGVSGMPSSRAVVLCSNDGALMMPMPACVRRHCAVQR